VCSLAWVRALNRLVLGAALREYDQAFAVEVKIDQREAGAQPMVILRQSAVADLVEAEDAFQDAKRMFYFGTHTRLTAVLCAL
jgi:hypothetical protein